MTDDEREIRRKLAVLKRAENLEFCVLFHKKHFKSGNERGNF